MSRPASREFEDLGLDWPLALFGAGIDGGVVSAPLQNEAMGLDPMQRDVSDDGVAKPKELVSAAPSGLSSMI